MTNAELRNKIEELKELEGLVKEAEAEIEALKDELKEEMRKQHKEEMVVERYTMRWKSVTTNRLDGKLLKESMPSVYDAYIRPSVSMRFSITG